VLWSSILQAPRITRGSQSSDSSLGSSFGCSLGSFPTSEADGEQKKNFIFISVSDPYSLNPDPDPDPDLGILLHPDPIRIQIKIYYE
jgi:hypothetical protein